MKGYWFTETLSNYKSNQKIEKKKKIEKESEQERNIVCQEK